MPLLEELNLSTTPESDWQTYVINGDGSAEYRTTFASIAERAMANIVRQLGWYNVKEHGLVGDGTTDDTAALQGLIDLVAAAGGGTIFFPDDGPYIFNGALQDTGAGGGNAQVLLPQIDIDEQQYSITFRGYAPPACSPSGFHSIDLPRGTVLKSTLSAGSGSFIGGAGPVGAPYSRTNFLHARFENLIIQMPANPNNHGLNLQSQTSVVVENCIIVAGNKLSDDLTEPTVTTYGLILPDVDRGICQELRGQVNVFGFYYGVRGGELMHVQNLCVAFCKYPIEFVESHHVSLIQRLLTFWCPSGILWSGEHCVDIQQWDVERTDATAWYTSVYEVNDPSNFGKGEIKWLTVLANTGRISDFNLNGGTGLIVREVGVAAASSAAPEIASLEIGTVAATTVVAVFNQIVKASSYSAGVTIDVNGTPATISSATRQATKTTIRYVLSAPVIDTDVVTFSYEGADGFLRSETGAEVVDIVDEAVTNNVSGGGSFLLEDTFTDTNGTLLPAHTMDVGPGWTKFEGGSSDPSIQSNKVVTTLDLAVAYGFVAESSEADANIQLSGTFHGWTNAHYLELVFRYADANNYWKLSVNGSGTDNFALIRVQDGTPTTEQQTSITLTAGVAYTFQVVTAGNDIDCVVNSVSLTTETNSFNATATKHGFRLYQGTTGVLNVDSFEVTAA